MFPFKLSFSRVVRALAICSTLAMSQNAHATLTFVVTQLGSDVVATGSGSLNTAGMTKTNSSISVAPTVFEGAAVLSPGIIVGPTPTIAVDAYNNDSVGTGPSTFGTTTTQILATSGTGMGFGFVFNIPGGPLPRVFVPVGYNSGTALSGTSTWANTSIAAMGLTPGTYVWNWTVTGGAAESVTLIINAVPEPATIGLAALGLLMAVFARRLRRDRVTP